MRKRILSALLAVMFLFTGLPGTAWAVGEGNMEAGGGQTETVTGDSFWNGQWGIRFCVVDVVSQSVVSATYDASNYGGLSNYWHYGKTNKFDYRNGATLTIRQGNYTLETPAVTIPTIVRTSGAPDIKAIKDYFTDETVIRWIGDVTGMAYDTLISGDYKLFIEPILYYTFDSQKYAMTATEAALFDRAINGLLLRTMGNATHQQLPLSLYLEKSERPGLLQMGRRQDRHPERYQYHQLSRHGYCQLHPGGGARARDRRGRRRPYRPDFLPKDRPGEI